MLAEKFSAKSCSGAFRTGRRGGSGAVLNGKADVLLADKELSAKSCSGAFRIGRRGGPGSIFEVTKIMFCLPTRIFLRNPGPDGAEPSEPAAVRTHARAHAHICTNMTAMRRDGAMTRRIGTQLERDAFPGSAAEGAALPSADPGLGVRVVIIYNVSVSIKKGIEKKS